MPCIISNMLLLDVIYYIIDHIWNILYDIMKNYIYLYYISYV